LFRTVTSKVSAVSSFVANGHQSMQHVSSSLSKIPYVGFSPVRLQTGIQPRPSLARRGLSARSAFTHSLPTYTWPKLLAQRGASPQPCWFFRNRAVSSSGTPFILAAALQSRGPWLANGLCCPVGSSLTIGFIRNSRPLPSIYVLLRWVFALRPCMGWYREAPQFAPRVLPLRAAFCTPVDRTVAHGCFFTVRTSLRHLCTGSASTTHTRRFSRGKRNEAAKFALCYGPEGSLALHRQGRLLPSFHLPKSPPRDVGYTMRANSQLPQPGLHRLDTRPYELQAEGAKIAEMRH